MNTLYSSEASFIWAFAQILYILYKKKALWTCFTPSQRAENELWFDTCFWNNDVCLLIQFKTINNQKDKNLNNQKKCILKYKEIISNKIKEIKEKYFNDDLNCLNIDILPIVIYWWVSKNRICLYLEDIENNKNNLFDYFLDKAESIEDKCLINLILRQNKHEIQPIKSVNVSSWLKDKVFFYSNNSNINNFFPNGLTI